MLNISWTFFILFKSWGSPRTSLSSAPRNVILSDWRAMGNVTPWLANFFSSLWPMDWVTVEKWYLSNFMMQCLKDEKVISSSFSVSRQLDVRNNVMWHSLSLISNDLFSSLQLRTWTTLGGGIYCELNFNPLIFLFSRSRSLFCIQACGIELDIVGKCWRRQESMVSKKISMQTSHVF